MIEASDIGDGEILSQTLREAGPNGTFRLSYPMPEGEPLQSEWLRPEDLKRATFAWMDAVRGALIGAAERKQDALRQAARDMETMAVEVTGIKDVPNVHANDPVRKVVDTTEDPVQHANSQVVLLQAEERHWSAELERAEKHLKTTRAKLSQWQIIQSSLEAMDK